MASIATASAASAASTAHSEPAPHPPACFHGGASFAAIGPRFDRLARRGAVVAADVLDAWFPPAPRVVAALRDELPWLLRAAPPADAAGLVAAVAEARGVAPESLLAGAGSSALIFLALPRWLPRGGRLLVVDPSYGEYAHVAERLCGATVERVALSAADGFRLDLAAVARRVARGVDVVVLVRPNNPTGTAPPRAELEAFLRELPARTVAWIDEAYVDFLGRDESLERFAATRPNVVVCKSLSKAYALAGARAAYLAGAPDRIAALQAWVPPWAVSLPAQLAAVRALESEAWYARRWAETPALRDALAAAIERAAPSLTPLPTLPNALLIRLPPSAPSLADVLARCAERGVYLRDVRSMGVALDDRWLRVAVQPRPLHRRIAAALAAAIDGSTNGASQRDMPARS